MKQNIKVISISPPSTSSKKKTFNKNEDIPLQLENITHYDKKNFMNKNDKEKEEYGYEIDQSYEKILFSNEKSNGEDKDFINIINANTNNNKRKIIKNNINNNRNDIPINNYNNGFIDNDTNNKKRYMKYSKNNNINDNNKHNFEKKIRKFNTIFISRGDNYKTDNKKMKKSLIVQQILINEMKKEIENLKFEIEKAQKEKQELNKIIDNQKNEIDLIKKINNEKNNEIEKFNGNKNLEENPNSYIIGKEDYKANIKENKNSNIIKDLYNKKLNVIQLNNDNKIIDKEFKEDSFLKLIDNSFTTIKDISNNIKLFNEKNKNNDKIIIKQLKDFIEHINSDNNGNITLNDKLITINAFNNIIKLQLEQLFKYIKNNNTTITNVDNNNNNNNNDIHLNDCIEHENGLNNNTLEKKLNTENKNYNNKKMFKKIDITNNKIKIIKINNNFENESKRKQLIMNDNFRYNNIINKLKDENSISNSKKKPNLNQIVLSSNLLEKNSIVYKSNLSPLSLELSLNSSNYNNFNLNYDKIMNKILDKKENEGEQYNTIKNIKLNTKGKVLSDLVTKSESLTKNIKESNKSLPDSTLFKKFKKYKIPTPDDISMSNTSNNNNKMPGINYVNAIHNNNNEKRYRPLYKKTSGTSRINYLNYTFDKILNISKHGKTNIKYNSLSNNHILRKMERNKINQLEYTKTDIKNKNNSEYIKINDIFKKGTNSKKMSDSQMIKFNKDNQSIVANEDISQDKSISSTENKTKIYTFNKNEDIIQKKPIKFITQPKTKNKILTDLNGLANEIMKPSFLKNNISILLNKKSKEKDKERNIVKEIKNYNFNMNNEMMKKIENNEK